MSLELLYYFFFPGFNFICDIHIMFFYTDTVPKLVVIVGGPFFSDLIFNVNSETD